MRNIIHSGGITVERGIDLFRQLGKAVRHYRSARRIKGNVRKHIIHFVYHLLGGFVKLKGRNGAAFNTEVFLQRVAVVARAEAGKEKYADNEQQAYQRLQKAVKPAVARIAPSRNYRRRDIGDKQHRQRNYNAFGKGKREPPHCLCGDKPYRLRGVARPEFGKRRTEPRGEIYRKRKGEYDQKRDHTAGKQSVLAPARNKRLFFFLGCALWQGVYFLDVHLSITWRQPKGSSVLPNCMPVMPS